VHCALVGYDIKNLHHQFYRGTCLKR